MNVSSAAQVQMLFGIAVQKSVLELQANAINTLLESVSLESPPSSPTGAALCADVSADCGIGTQVNIIV